MARKIAEGIIAAGIEVKIFDINQADRTEVIKEMLDAKAFVFGSSTHDNSLLPSMAGFLEFVRGLSAKNRIACAFGSFGLAGVAVRDMEKLIQSSGINLASPGLGVKFVPDAAEEKACVAFGREIADKVNA